MVEESTVHDVGDAASEHFARIETQFAKLKSDYEAAVKDREELVKQATEATDKVAAASASALAATSALAEVRLQSSQWEREASRLEGLRASAVERARLAEERAQQLAAARAAEAKTAAEASVATREANRRAAELEAKIGPEKASGERFRLEKEAVESHAAWLETELEARGEELRRARKEATAKISQLESSLDAAREDGKARGEALARSREALAEAEREADSLRAECRTLKSDAAAERASFEADLAAEKRVAVALVEEADASKKRANDLENALKRTEKKSAQVCERAEAEVKAAKAEAAELLEEAAGVARERLEELEGQLEEYKSKATKASEALSSGAASPETSALYERCVTAERSLEEVRAELRRSELYMERVGREIEKKKCVWEKERKEKASAIKAYDALAVKHHKVVTDLEGALNNVEKAEAERKAWASEKMSLEQTARDLSHQVQRLLEGAALRTGATLPKPYSRSLEDEDAQRLTEEMVTIGSIEQLQQRNVRLLRVVRKLAAESEENRQNAIQADDAAATAALEETLTELDELRSARERQQALVSDLAAQRDSYAAQLKELKKGSSSHRGESADPPALLADDEEERQIVSVHQTASGRVPEEIEAELEMMSKDLALATQAKDFYVEALESAKQQAVEASKRESQARADLDFERSRSSRIEAAAQGARGEAERADRERERAVAEAAKWEAAAGERYEELRATILERDDMKRREAEALRGKQVAEAAATRAADRAATAEDEVRRAQVAMEGVASLEAALQSRTQADTTGLISRLEAAETQLAAARDQNVRDHENYEKRCRDLETKAEAAATDARNRERELLEANTLLATERAAREHAEHVAKRLTTIPPSLTDEVDTNRATALTSVLRADADALRLELELATAARDGERARCDELTTLVKSHEAALAEAQSTAEELREDFEKRLADANSAVDEANATAAESRAALAARDAAVEEHNTEVQSLSAQLQDAVEAANDAIARADAATARRDEAEEAAGKAQALLTDASLERERELAVHVAHVAALNASTVACMAAIAERDALQQRLGAFDEHDSEKAAAESAAVLAVKAELDTANERVTELEKQRDILTNQFALATATVERLERRGNEETMVSSPSPQGEETDNDRAVRELRQLVDMLRRDKELAEAKLAVSERGRSRDAARAKAANEALAVARAEREALAKDLEKLHPEGISSAGAHAEAAAQQLSLLRESNAQLRSTAQRAQERLSTVKREAEEVRAKLGPTNDELAAAKSRISSVERELAAKEREIAAWRARVDSLVAKSKKKQDENDRQRESELEDAHKECENLKLDLERVAESLEEATRLANRRDAAWAKDVAQSSARYLRSLKADMLHRKALENASSATETAEAKTTAIEASANAVREDLAKSEAKLRKATGLLRTFKQKNNDLASQLEIVQKAASTAGAALGTSQAPPPQKAVAAPSSGAATAPAEEKRGKIATGDAAASMDTTAAASAVAEPAPPSGEVVASPTPAPKIVEPPSSKATATPLSPQAPSFVPAPTASTTRILPPADTGVPRQTRSQKRARAEVAGTAAATSEPVKRATAGKRVAATSQPTAVAAKKLKRTATGEQESTVQAPQQAVVAAPAAAKTTAKTTAVKKPARKTAGQDDVKLQLQAKMKELEQQISQSKQASTERVQPSSTEEEAASLPASVPATGGGGGGGVQDQIPSPSETSEGAQVLLKTLNQQQRRQKRAARFEQSPEEKKDDAPGSSS